MAWQTPNKRDRKIGTKQFPHFFQTVSELNIGCWWQSESPWVYGTTDKMWQAYLRKTTSCNSRMNYINSSHFHFWTYLQLLAFKACIIISPGLSPMHVIQFTRQFKQRLGSFFDNDTCSFVGILKIELTWRELGTLLLFPLEFSPESDRPLNNAPVGQK